LDCETKRKTNAKVYIRQAGKNGKRSLPVIAWNMVAVLISFLSVGAYLHFVRKEKAESNRLLGSWRAGAA
jgi:hypothetical protein